MMVYEGSIWYVRGSKYCRRLSRCLRSSSSAGGKSEQSVAVKKARPEVSGMYPARSCATSTIAHASNHDAHVEYSSEHQAKLYQKELILAMVLGEIMLTKNLWIVGRLVATYTSPLSLLSTRPPSQVQAHSIGR